MFFGVGVFPNARAEGSKQPCPTGAIRAATDVRRSRTCEGGDDTICCYFPNGVVVPVRQIAVTGRIGRYTNRVVKPRRGSNTVSASGHSGQTSKRCDFIWFVIRLRLSGDRGDNGVNKRKKQKGRYFQLGRGRDGSRKRRQIVSEMRRLVKSNFSA
jgi:hypothetical protein